MSYPSQRRAESKVEWGEYGECKVWKLSSQLPTYCENLGELEFFLFPSCMMQVKVLHEFCTIKIYAFMNNSGKRALDRAIQTNLAHLSS